MRPMEYEKSLISFAYIPSKERKSSDVIQAFEIFKGLADVQRHHIAIFQKEIKYFKRQKNNRDWP